ncbi:MAG: carbon storage regulator [Planctomycetaceae bacterium]|jgi:carbon storage regulator
MLVLSRKIGDRIVIDGGIEVVVLAVEGGRVRLGIAAPRDCQIVRGELLDDSSRGAPPPNVVPPANLSLADRSTRPATVDCLA